MEQVLLGVAAVAAEMVLGPFQQGTVGRGFLSWEIPFSQRPTYPYVYRERLQLLQGEHGYAVGYFRADALLFHQSCFGFWIGHPNQGG